MSISHSIMHFTHIRNLPGILTAGYLEADSLVDRMSALKVEAADLKLKARRKVTGIGIEPYGCVADYVPFYFAPRSPMLCKVANNGVENYTEGQDPLIYLVSSAEDAAATGASCLFSDGNCASKMTRIFDDLALLDSVVDWEVMRSRMWANTAEDGDRRRRRMAEFLVHERFPIECLSEVVVRRDTMKKQVNRALAACSIHLPVQVRPDWYF